MTPGGKILLGGSVVGAVFAGLMFARPLLPVAGNDSSAAEPASLQVSEGDLRPAFSLQGIDGLTHSVSEWDGKVLAINFWATWCAPCRKEIPEFIALQKEYGDAGLQFVGIAIDDVEKVSAYAAEFGINYPLLVGDDDAISAGFAYGNDIGALPFTAIVDRAGRIVLRKQGVLSHQQALATIKKLL
jgi:thiol-disulfide isomerase/thioredoxin